MSPERSVTYLSERTQDARQPRPASLPAPACGSSILGILRRDQRGLNLPIRSANDSDRRFQKVRPKTKIAAFIVRSLTTFISRIFMGNRVKLLSAFIVLSVGVGFCAVQEKQKTENEESEIIELASDAYLKVADLDLVIPIIALLEPRYAYTPYSFSLGSNKPSDEELEKRAESKKLPTKPETAPKVDRVQILIRQYQYTGELASSQKICPLLKRDWAKSFCKGEHSEVMQKLPEKLFIVDEEHIDLFASHYTVGQERVSDQIRKLNLNAQSVDISCDGNGKFCTAGIQTSPSTLAIWTVWPSEKLARTAREIAKSQGEAIRAFVKHAIGTQSDFDQFKAEIISAP